MQVSEKLREKFEAAERVCVLTGAGVPTVRGGGQAAVWKGMPFDEISSALMVRENLPEVWEWFDYRRGVLRDCAPNAAHFALAEWEIEFEKFTLVTQNIDGLHAAAGSRAVVELHGNIHRAYCADCGKRFDIRGKIPHEPDLCDECGARLRPDVVLFGEMLNDFNLMFASSAAVNCDLFFVIGTSALVHPAAGFAQIAKRAGAYLVEINPEETPMSRLCDETIRGRAGEVLPLF